MARPYINTSDKNGSLLNPMSSGSNTPISYRANVNRQKTKKWTEAKKIDYGGDDWGDDDEYGDYGYEPEPEPKPAPISKLAGLRQQGQGPYGARAQSQERSQKSYGSLPSAGGANRARSNSFEADDEQRHFSNSTIVPQQSPPSDATTSTSGSNTGPATRFSQLVGGPRGKPDPTGPPALSIYTEQASNTGSRKPSLPSNPAHPEPSYTNRTNDSSNLPAGYTPQSARDAPATRFPARKSSLSTINGPPPGISQPQQDTSNARSRNTSSSHSPSPGNATRSATAPGASVIKPLPFIRPADIYRRAEEERRASLDSSRPSMDSMDRSSDRSQSPDPGIRERSSSDSLGPNTRRRTSFGDESTDSGRRLMPILEPVQERKSEYGFEGFNADGLNSPAQDMSSPPVDTKPSELRSSSTSPKLPNLNRISGFGTDFFSQSKPESEETHRPQESEGTNSNPATNDTGLRSQPSVGFRSVVNQAFDTVPPTPASQTGSDIKRTDSESTGTAGISPIMSRVPSSAIQDTRGREISTPAIMEVMEPKSPSQEVQHDELPEEEPLPPSFIPGHRRNISTPSPGNSPARTPDLASTKRISMGEHAWISSGSPTSAIENEEAPVEVPRPVYERDESFRPQLPGGWQSYATTATTTSTIKPESVRSESPERPIDEPLDLTPTTSKHTLPNSSLEAAAITLGINSGSMPTPDPMMAPSGNVYSAMQPDPRLAPTLESVSPEAQLRADVPVEPLSITPSPLGTKNNPTLELTDDTTHRTLDEDGDEEFTPNHFQRTDTMLSVDDRLSDEENDTLRKEIVKTLGPRTSQTPQYRQTVNEPIDSSPPREARESSYLTDVYDDYWGDTGDEGNSSPLAKTSFPAREPEALQPAMPEIRPLSSHRISEQLHPPLKNKFSWEKSTESLPQVHVEAEDPHSGVELPTETMEKPTEQLQQIDPEPEPYMEKEVVENYSQDDHHPGRDAALLGGAGLGGSAAAMYHGGSAESPPAVNISLAEETDNRHSVVSLPSAEPSNTDENETYVSSLNYTSDPLGSNPHSPASIPSAIAQREHSPVPRPTTGKVMSFKEIIAIQDTKQRVQKFNETRERFAAMDSGLEEWILALQAQQPEHENVTASYGGIGAAVIGTARSKNRKSIGPGSLQAPYYQQYLNASSPTPPAAPPSRSGSSAGAGLQQGFSPAAAKLTSQQVQAKGKEFLHSAGIFGGKAGKAGKGLLAKGKSRLRAAGGGDKTSPPPKPKNPNRSSWSIGLNLSRASVQHAAQHNPNEPTNYSEKPTPSELLTSAGTTESPTSDGTPQVFEKDSSSREIGRSQILALDALEGVASFSTPTSKFQPTWDFDFATSTTKRAEPSYDEESNRNLTINHVKALAAPPGNPTSTRSNSDDAREEHALGSTFVLDSSVMEDSKPRFTSHMDLANKSPTSMMDRPRGDFDYSVTSSPQPRQPTINAIQAHPPASSVPQPSSQNPIGPEGPARQSSFKGLPPIRRTSKFGFEFGSRRPQTRFPISDDEDDVSDIDDSDLLAQDPTRSSIDPTPSDDITAVAQQVSPSQLPISKYNNTTPRRATNPIIGHVNQQWRTNPTPSHSRHDSWNQPLKQFSFERQPSSQVGNSDQTFGIDSVGQSTIPTVPFEQPPSSAQRYPELFGGQSSGTNEIDYMPRGYYQAPIGRAEAFHPRQPTSEFELPGVGPPQQDEAQPSNRRRSGSFGLAKGINAIVRVTSRERKGSVSKEDPVDTRTSAASNDDKQKRRRGSAFWGNSDFTKEQPSNSPIGGESMVAHYSGSQSNLPPSPGNSPISSKPIFNPTSASSSPQRSKLGRSITEAGKGDKKDEKWKKLNGLGGIFSRTTKPNTSSQLKPKRATVDFSKLSPKIGTDSSSQGGTSVKASVEHSRRPSQQVNFLSKFTPSPSSTQKTENKPPQQKDTVQQQRQRRPSVSGLLNGMLRKRSNTTDNHSERSEEEGRKPSVVVPAARMYSELPAKSHEDLPDPAVTPQRRKEKGERARDQSSTKSIGTKNPSSQSDSHGGRPRRGGAAQPNIHEPQYDTVPIPGGYDRVRGEGSSPASRRPSHTDTAFTPSPVSPILQTSPLSNIRPPPPLLQIPFQKSINSHVSPGNTKEYFMVANGREGEDQEQQRPYQLALPGNGTDSESTASTPPVPPPKDYPVNRGAQHASSSPHSTTSQHANSTPSQHANSSQHADQPDKEEVDLNTFPLPPDSPRQQIPTRDMMRRLEVGNEGLKVEGLQRSRSEATSVSAVSGISDTLSREGGEGKVGDRGGEHKVVERVVSVDGDMHEKRESADLYDASPIVASGRGGAGAGASGFGGEATGASAGEVGEVAGEGKTDGNKSKGKGKENVDPLTVNTEDKEEEKIQMSATSWPGMEWNPYENAYSGDS